MIKGRSLTLISKERRITVVDGIPIVVDADQVVHALEKPSEAVITTQRHALSGIHGIGHDP